MNTMYEASGYRQPGVFVFHTGLSVESGGQAPAST